MTIEAMIAGTGLAGLNFLGQREANEMNLQIAREQMDFQERMSSTAHQREVNDLRLAGLNPILSATLGGSSTPPGAKAEMANQMAPAISTAMQARRLSQEIDNMKETNKQIKEQTNVLKQDAKQKMATTAKQVQETKVAEQVEKIRKAQSAGAKTEEEIDNSAYGKSLRYINRFLNSLNPFSSSAKNLKEANK